MAHQLTQAAAKVARRRLGGRPRHPEWSFRYAALVEYLTRRFEKVGEVHAARRALDQAGKLETRKNRVGWERVNAAGVPGLWAHPRPRPEAPAAVLYLHGGGYVIGSTESHRFMTAGIAAAGGISVLGIDYRLAPEHPCPAAIDDAVIAYQWLLSQGIRSDNLVIAGDSAGGGLTLTTLLALRDRGLPLPAAAVCISPWCDMTLSGASLTANAGTDYLTVEGLRAYAKQYQHDLPPTDPRVSPLFADLSGLPPLLIQAGGAEVLLDDAREVARRAEEAGVEVSLEVTPHQVHVWHSFADVDRGARNAIERVARFARDRLTSP